jgi:hypothetical protein
MAVTETPENQEAAAGLAEDLNELRNELARICTRLDRCAEGLPGQPLAQLAKEAAALGRSVTSYAATYED